MSKNDEIPEIKEYAGGWITERKNTDVPGFLKYAYIVIALGCVAYCVRYMHGVLDDSVRGNLVEQFNQATLHSDGLMYLVAALATICGLIVVVFAFRKMHHD